MKVPGSQNIPLSPLIRVMALRGRRFLPTERLPREDFSEQDMLLHFVFNRGLCVHDRRGVGQNMATPRPDHRYREIAV